MAATRPKGDWTQLSRPWRVPLDARITELVRLRDQLDSCIGCGCLSLRGCQPYSRGDRAAPITGAAPAGCGTHEMELPGQA